MTERRTFFRGRLSKGGIHRPERESTQARVHGPQLLKDRGGLAGVHHLRPAAKFRSGDRRNCPPLPFPGGGGGGGGKPTTRSALSLNRCDEWRPLRDSQASPLETSKQREQSLQQFDRRRRAAANVQIDRHDVVDAAADRHSCRRKCRRRPRNRRPRPPISDRASRCRCAPAPRACSWSPARSPSARRHGAARRRSAGRSVRDRRRHC